MEYLETEASVLGYYLIGKAPTSAAKLLYREAVAAKTGSKAHAKTLDIATQHPALLPYLDAYDAWFRPDSQLRQRLHLAFSVLEATPEFAADFLPSKRSAWYVLAVGLLGVRGVFRLIIGCLIVRVWGL